MSADDSQALVGGFHAVEAAFEQGREIRRVWLATDRHDSRIERLARAANRPGVTVTRTDMASLDAMLPNVRHQGCIAQYVVAQALRESELPELLAAQSQPWLLALDQIQDPHNLGACLRSAAAAGVSAVIAPRKRSAGLSPAVRKVAAGAAERVAFVPVTNLVRALSRLQDDGFWVVGLDAAAPLSIYAETLPQRLVLVAGGEARGLRELTARHCDTRVHIPMARAIESLNVSVAAGVALFEARRQRLAPV